MHKLTICPLESAVLARAVERMPVLRTINLTTGYAPLHWHQDTHDALATRSIEYPRLGGNPKQWAWDEDLQPRDVVIDRVPGPYL